MFFSPTEELFFKMNAYGRTFHCGKSIGKDDNSSVISVVSFPIDFPQRKVLPKALTLKQSSFAGEKNIMLLNHIEMSGPGFCNSAQVSLQIAFMSAFYQRWNNHTSLGLKTIIINSYSSRTRQI